MPQLCATAMTHSVAVKDSFSFVRQLSMLVCRYDACVCVGTTHGMHMPEMLHLRHRNHSCMHETAIIHEACAHTHT